MDSPTASPERDSASIERPRIDTWGASPIDPSSPEVRARQYEMSTTLVNRADKALDEIFPHLEPEELGKLKDYVAINVMQRAGHEDALNYESYMKRLSPVITDEALLAAFARAQNSSALPGEVFDLRKALIAASAEGGKLSHLAGAEMAQLDIMRSAFAKEVKARGGTWYEKPETTLTPVTTDVFMRNEPKLGLITMNRKRHLGEFREDDGTITYVREKSQFVLRVDPGSDLDPRLSSALRSLTLTDKDHGRTVAIRPDWQQRICEVEGLHDAVYRALDADAFHIAIPISTTIYVYNPDVQRAIEVADMRARTQPAPTYGKPTPGRPPVFLRETDGSVTYGGAEK